jgi:hypothetical protein
MCGIARIIGRLDEPNRAALERMSGAMVHRGPDDSGTWVSAPDSRGLGTLLGFRRLSILDLSPAGARPMVDPMTGRVMVFLRKMNLLLRSIHMPGSSAVEALWCLVHPIHHTTFGFFCMAY